MAEQIVVDIDFDNGKAKIKLDDLQKSINQTATKAGQSFSKNFEGSINNSLNALTKRVAFIGASIGAALFGREAIRNATEQQDAINDLNSSLQRTGLFTDQISKNFQQFATDIQGSTRIADDAVLKTTALIQSLAGLQEQELRRATLAAIDLSSALGIDLVSSARLVGKAAVGSVEALGRYGIVLGDNIPKGEKFAALLNLIESKFGGAARQDVQTFSGQLEQLGNLTGDSAEEFGLFVTNSDAVRESLKVVNQEIFNFNSEIAKTRDGSGDIFREIIPPLADFASGFFEFFIQPIELGVRTLNILKLELASTFQDIGITVIDLFLDKINSIPDVLILAFEKLGINIGQAKTTLEEIRETAVTAGDSIKTNLDNAFNNFTDETFSQRIADSFERISQAAENSTARVTAAARKRSDETVKSDRTELLSKNFLVSQISNSTQALVKGFREGQDAGDVFKNILLDVAGNIAIQVGTTLLGVGNAIQALQLSLTTFTGGPAIAAGIALIALGALLKSFAGGSATAGTAAGGVGGVGGVTPVEDITPDEIAEREPRTLVNLTVNGDILDSQDTPRRLARLLNASFKEEGTRILSGV